MRLLVFDADSNLVGSQTQQLSQAARTGYEPLQVQVIAQQDGYVTVYVGNESAADVYLDDVRIEHRQGLQVQENQYDPFGLELAGVSGAAPGLRLKNFYQFNGKENQLDLGLNWNHQDARFYDYQIGRWHSVDELSDEMRRISPYAYCFNNPLRYTDPDGMKPYDDYQLKRDGKIELLKKTTDNFDRLYASKQEANGTETVDKGTSLTVEKGVLDNPIQQQSPYDEATFNTFYVVNNIKTATSLFEFASNNSDVEFGHLLVQTQKGNSVSAVATSNSPGDISALRDLELDLNANQPNLTVKRVDHSHPVSQYSDDSYEGPSGFRKDGTPRQQRSGDRQNAQDMEAKDNAHRNVYTPTTGRYTPYNSKGFTPRK